MNKALIMAGAVAALAFTGAANAQPVSATTDATATARIYTPLTLTSTQDLDLGTIVLSGVSPYTDTVSIDQSGAFVCGAGANLTCSGTTQTALYEATGTLDQDVTVTVASTLDLVNQTQTAPNLVMAVDAPGTVTLDGTGYVEFAIGGSIDVSDSTADGVYQGTFAVSAEYQ